MLRLCGALCLQQVAKHLRAEMPTKQKMMGKVASDYFSGSPRPVCSASRAGLPCHVSPDMTDIRVGAGGRALSVTVWQLQSPSCSAAGHPWLIQQPLVVSVEYVEPASTVLQQQCPFFSFSRAPGRVLKR